MRRTLNSCAIYISTWLLYNLQGILYQSGGFISQCLLLFLLLWSIVFVFKVNRIKHVPLYFKSLNLLVALFSIYGVLLIVSGKQLYITEGTKTLVSNSTYLKNILASLLPIYAFYYFSRIGQLTEKALRRWSFVFIGVALFQFIRSHQQLIYLSSDNITETTNNAGYLFLYLMPSLILFKNKKILQYALLILFVIFLLFSMKRGAIIIGVLALVVIILQNIKYSPASNKIGVILLSIVCIIVAYYYFSSMLQDSEYFQMRIEATMEGDDSNRSMIYSNLMQTFTEDSSVSQILMGRGANGTLEVGSNYAHNDWLEILTNQGILGVVVYLVYWISFFSISRDRNYSKINRFCIFLIFMICFSKTLFSMSYSSLNIYITSILGLALANSITDNDE